MVDSLLHGEWDVGTTLGLTTLCMWDQGCLPWQGGVRNDLLLGVPTQSLLLHKLSAWVHKLCGSCRRKEQQNLIFVIKVKCSSFMWPWKAESMSTKMPFPCIHFSMQNSLFMQRVQFCKNPYWGQHNLLIIESSGKFCSSENWQIKPIRQFLRKK